MRVEAFPTDPLQIRALTLRQRSLLRQYATEAAGLDESVSLLASGPEPVAKPKKRGRRAVRFAPLVDVYERSEANRPTPTLLWFGHWFRTAG